MPGTEADGAIRIVLPGFASEGLWEQLSAAWPPPVRRGRRLHHLLHPHHHHLHQRVIVRCPGIGKSGGILIPVTTNGCGFLHTRKAILAGRYF
jgi:hypothetical protein